MHKVNLNENYDIYVISKPKNQKYTYDLDVFIYSRKLDIFREVKWNTGIACTEEELHSSIADEIFSRNSVGYFDEYIKYFEEIKL